MVGEVEVPFFVWRAKRLVIRLLFVRLRSDAGSSITPGNVNISKMSSIARRGQCSIDHGGDDSVRGEWGTRHENICICNSLRSMSDSRRLIYLRCSECEAFCKRTGSRGVCDGRADSDVACGVVGVGIYSGEEVKMSGGRAGFEVTCDVVAVGVCSSEAIVGFICAERDDECSCATCGKRTRAAWA